MKKIIVRTLCLALSVGCVLSCGGGSSGGEGAGSDSGGGSGGGTPSVSNRAPVAELTSGSAKTGRAVQLDASASSDPDRDTLSYAWTLVSKPSDSLLTLSSTNQSTTSIVPDVDGEYQVQVTVRDPAGRTSSKTLTLNAQADANLAPVVRSFTSERASLNAGEALGFNWTVVDPNRSSVTCTFDPTGSGSTIDLPGCATNPIATHTYDKPGVYQPRLTVTDAEGLAVTFKLTAMLLFNY